MPLGTKTIEGLTHQQAADGLLKVSEIPGDGGLGPSIAVIIATASGLPPNNPTISIQLFPTEKSSIGTDSNGNISVTATISNTGNDKLFNVTGGGTVNLTEGFWNQALRAQVNSTLGTRGFNLQFTTLDPATDFPNVLTEVPYDLSHDDPSWDSEEEVGQITIYWNYDNTAVENPTGFAIERNGVVIGSIPWESTIVDYNFADTIFATGTYSYKIRAYKYGAPNAISARSAADSIVIDNTLPDIALTGSGGIDLGGAATMMFITEPSGIYTLVPNKTDDTLYNGSSSVDVPIPNPFIETAFLGE